MAIDIRATVTCSLGTLISGSISDDYLQGSGLVKTRGSCEISALITPAVGTVVTFSYTKGGVTRTIPRKLRVLSSFADPFRRTTKVELGCKLTYLSDLQEPVKWDAFDDPENASYDTDDQRIVTLPIYASSVMTKCLTELGITASSSPLTNKFSIAEFDFGGGYVQVLGDLLVSESYFGYLDINEVLQVASLDQEGGTGPVYTGADIVDLGPIGTGPLPGEAVTVSYSSLKLKDPDANADNDAINWEASFVSSLVEVPITYTPASGGTAVTQVYRGIESTQTFTSYTTLNSQSVVQSRVSTETRIAASVAGALINQYLSNGLTFPGYSPVVSTTSTFYLYDDEGNEIQSDTLKQEQLLAIYGDLGLQMVFSPSDYVVFTLGSNQPRYTTERVLVQSQPIGDYTNSTTQLYGLWNRTIAGQQSIAESRDSLTTANEVTAYVGNTLSNSLNLLNVTVQTAQVGRAKAQARPSEGDRTNAAYAKDGDPNNGWRTESQAQLELALGSATAQRRIEFSLPYAPDDTFSGPTGGPFTATASDAPAKANRYGRVQNRLLLGNRSGVNLQLAPERLPAAPFTPLYLQADGLTALYRANGNQWAFDSNGIVCSTDALFWAGVGGTGTFWFPVAPGITTLPAEPAIVDGAMNATNVVLPYNETAVYNSRLRLGNVVTKFDYALELLTVVPPLTVKTRVTVRSATLVEVPATSIALAGLAPFAGFVDTAQSSLVQTVVYAGTGSAQTINTTYVDPSLILVRNYQTNLTTYTAGPILIFDKVRGSGLYWDAAVQPAAKQVSNAQTVSAFGNASFSVGTSTLVNDATRSYMAWVFGGTGAPVTNTDGTITSTVSTSDVMSVISYTGNGTSGATFGHGMAGTPDAVLIKLIAGGSFTAKAEVGGPILGTNYNIVFGDTLNGGTDSSKIRTADSTTITVGNSTSVNEGGGGRNYIAYAFRSVAGRSKVGTYTGNGSGSGQFIDCDFPVDFVLVKALASSGYWRIFDRTYEGGGTTFTAIDPANPYTEAGIMYGIESDGFRVFTGGYGDDIYDSLNKNGVTYFYMAFAAVRPTAYVDTTANIDVAPLTPSISAT
jgi:hypothetical protein